MTEKRRGRKPVSKNKPKTLIAPLGIAHHARQLLRDMQKEVPINKETFNQAIEKMMSEEKKVDWEELAKKQENQMQVLRLENEDLAKICVDRWETIQDKDKIIRYLESRIENLTIRSR